MNLSKAVVLRRLPLETPVRDICHFDVVSVDAEDFVFEALLLMTRHDKRRVAVRRDGAYVGFLEDIDILGLVAGNSQLIPGRIDRARSVDDLAAPARDIQAQVERLHRQGVKVEQIAEITSDLNRRLFVKLFDLLAPPSIREKGCLLLMGSEGRGEQTVRTDQDNGLLLAEPVPAAELDRFREAFSGALDGFGFPPCPGNVMVRNPVWSQPLDGLVRQLRVWVLERSPEAAMNLGIFFDAVAVAGRAELLGQAKAALVETMRGEQALLARFAHLIETFDTPALGVLSTLMASVGVGSDEIDIKKAGTFPIVHGVRTLALDRGIVATPTAGRIEALVEAGALRAGVRAGAGERAPRLHGLPAALPARSRAPRRRGAGGDGAGRAISPPPTATSCATRSASSASSARSSATATTSGPSEAVARGALWRLFWRASLADHSYRFLFQPGPEGEAVSLDCETTGLDPARGRRHRGRRGAHPGRPHPAQRALRGDRPAGGRALLRRGHQGAPAARARRGGRRADAPRPAGAAPLHRRAAAGRLLHRLRRADARQVRAVAAADQAAEPADRGLLPLLRAQVRRTRRPARAST